MSYFITGENGFFLTKRRINQCVNSDQKDTANGQSTKRCSLVSLMLEQKGTKEERAPGSLLFLGVLRLFSRNICNIWQQGSKSIALCWIGCPTSGQLLYQE